MQTITIDELLKDGGFEKAMLQVNVMIEKDIENIYHYYDNDYLLDMLKCEIDEIVDLIRRSHTIEGIVWIPFEYYISGIYHDMFENPSAEVYEKIKEDILIKWVNIVEGCGCGC